MLDRVSVALLRSGFSPGAMSVIVQGERARDLPHGLGLARQGERRDIDAVLADRPERDAPEGPVQQEVGHAGLGPVERRRPGRAIPDESRTLPSIASNARVRRVVLDMATSLLLAPSNHDDGTRVAAQNTADRETGQSEARDDSRRSVVSARCAVRAVGGFGGEGGLW